MVFFATYFGFDPSTARRYPDGVIIIRDAEDFALALGEAQDAEHTPGFPNFGFDMDSPEEVQALRARLVADGIELVDDEDTETLHRLQVPRPRQARDRGDPGDVCGPRASNQFEQVKQPVDLAGRCVNCLPLLQALQNQNGRVGAHVRRPRPDGDISRGSAERSVERSSERSLERSRPVARSHRRRAAYPGLSPRWTRAS
jgi:hypothetical protein